MAAGSSPAPFDMIPDNIMCSWDKYINFLKNYIHKYNITKIILDTFPWGIVGEWKSIALDIPKLLIARSLKWEEYKKSAGQGHGPPPDKVLIIEPLELQYMKYLQSKSNVHELKYPIEYSIPGEDSADRLKTVPSDNWVVIHSGNSREQDILTDYALYKFKKKVRKGVELHKIFPSHGFFPAQKIIKDYSVIVSGAGYNMAVMASLAAPYRKHFLFPFIRRYDDQYARVDLVNSGYWECNNKNGAQLAGKWLEESLH